MPATKTQLIGGLFQDSEGNALALGYLIMRLNQDETVTGVGSICSGITIRIALDSNGSVVTSPAQSVWANSDMSPINSYYRVTGYTASGQPAWGPNNQQVVSGATYDVGAWTPNTVLSWFPSVQNLELEVNGTPNVVQSVLDFEDTATVTWVDNGDGSVSATAITTAPTLGTLLPGWWMCCDGSNYPFDGSNGQFGAGTGNLVKFWMIRVPYPITVKTMTFRYNGAGSGGVGGMAIYNSTGTTKLVSFDNFAFSGGAGPKVITNSVGGAVAVNLPQGIYIVACAQSIGPTSATTQGGYKTQGSSDNTNGWNANATIRSGTAANAMVAGVLPASLGALSLSTAVGTSLPCCCFEPGV